ncbi:hypothetical protein BDM02DRAFT_3119373 [Thelephora ganbajun]|uniref:Uncharacterized protein n=1 Tax=Thelephora ganbajun TaxID=370292 RepID=A0ACB6ZA02_THEGA|nr:hypothetical protein BDM02DRAFT_3119373 [Thelephora ganbajun]
MYRMMSEKLRMRLPRKFIEVRRIGAGSCGSGSNHLRAHGDKKIAKKSLHRLALASTIGRDPCYRRPSIGIQEN